MAYQAVREFIPFYPVYALLFAETGLSTGQISTLFIIWSATHVLLEVPSGALADVVSRRALLIASAIVYGATFAVWAAFPSYPTFALGFVLWGISGAIASGAYEAYVYDQLAAHDRLRSYPRIIARGRAGGFVLTLAATLLASVLIKLGGFDLIGAASVAVCAVLTLIAVSLPRDAQSAPAQPADPGELRGYGAMLRGGLAEVYRSRSVRWAVLLAALVPGFLAFDEYFPLLAASLGTDIPLIPVLIAGVDAAQALGALAAERLHARSVVPWMVAGAVLLGAGAQSGHPGGFVAIAAGYGLLQLAIVVVETRLQGVIEGAARATVTSVTALLSELFAIAIYAGFALGSIWLSLISLVTLLAVALLVLAAVVAARQVQERRTAPESATMRG
ncbi:MAG: MFS transporter [Jiangellaceae bacterium]